MFDESTGWVVISDFVVPAGWSKSEVDLGVRIPENLPGQEPYGFWVRGGISLADGATPSNYSFPGERVPLFPEDLWGQFSWAPIAWAPGAEPGRGTSMVSFVFSISKRLQELN
jgi:hypothetical protein